jgi:hypothetical protein
MQEGDGSAVVVAHAVRAELDERGEAGALVGVERLVKAHERRLEARAEIAGAGEGAVERGGHPRGVERRGGEERAEVGAERAGVAAEGAELRRERVGLAGDDLLLLGPGVEAAEEEAEAAAVAEAEPVTAATAVEAVREAGAEDEENDCGEGAEGAREEGRHL